MATTRTPRGSWVDAGLKALAKGGPGAVKIEALARALKVTKGGFYWHYTDRDALLTEILDAWERRGVDEVIKQVDAAGGDGREKLLRLFTLTASIPNAMATELAIRDWARRDARVARRLRRVDNRRIEYLRGLFGDFCRDDDEVEARCLLVMTLFIGNPLVAADHPRRTRADVLGLIGERLLA